MESVKRSRAMMSQEIGQRLRAWRGDRTQFELAVSLGVTPQNISDYENGKVPQSMVLLAGLARQGCDLHWLLIGRPKNGGGK